MTKKRHARFAAWLPGKAFHFALCLALFVAVVFSGQIVRAQETGGAVRPAAAADSSGSSSMDSTGSTTTAQTAERLVVRGEEVPSAYGAPPALSRSRFSNLVNAYVLPPYAVYAALIYEGDALRFNRPDHSFTEEVELGLPYRFGVAVENEIETFRGTTQERSFSLASLLDRPSPGNRRRIPASMSRPSSGRQTTLLEPQSSRSSLTSLAGAKAPKPKPQHRPVTVRPRLA